MSLVQCMITRRRSINRHVNVVHSTMISPSIIRPLHMNMDQSPNVNVLCSSPSANHTVDTTHSQLQVHQGQHQTPDNNNNKIGSCKECLFTGVGVCTGLSIYFMKLASEVHIPTNNKDAAKIHTTIKEAIRQKRFLIGCSAVSAVTGAYRLYLG